MNEKPTDVKQAIVELMENLGTIGALMLGEVRAFLRKSWGASREEFSAAVDQTARAMKQTSKMAGEEIDRAARKIKDSWELLDKERNLDWDDFLNDLKSRLKTMSDVTQETFDLCVNQAKSTLDKQWTAVGRLGDEQLKSLQSHTEQMAKSFKEQWGVFREYMEKTGKKIDRAVEAAWEELKKKD
jgi:hypothetical protein